MTDRILDLSQEPVALSVHNDLLMLRREGQEVVTVPLCDLAAVVVSNPQVTYTQAVLARLAQHGAAFVVCDDKHLPTAMVLPLSGHHLQAERFDRQAHATQPTRKRLWQQIVRAKITAQAHLLERLGKGDAGLLDLVPRVRSGDPQNVEAQAARKYWPALFGPDFRRDFEAENQNRHLNYGYAILRGTVTRALCASGLHPSLGLHHHNRYDAFCLASDLAEPFRPLVDEAVFRWVGQHGPHGPLDPLAKRALLSITESRYNVAGQSRSLFDTLAHVAASLAAVFDGRQRELDLPEF